MCKQVTWFLDSLVHSGKEEEFATGMIAFVWLYYMEYTDATAIEPEVLTAMERLLATFNTDSDMVQVVVAAEQDINKAGGIVGSDNTRHRVRTFTDPSFDEDYAE